MPDSSRGGITAILFTDLVNSTALTQRVGDEQAQRIFQEHHEALATLLATHHGEELQWEGDGLMAAFASAANAVHCAIAMQRAALQPVRGHRLEMRGGLNAGEVLRQEIGSGHFGTPVVIASRLCDRAEAGQILTTGVVAGLLAGRHAVRFQDLGPAQLKGIEAPVAVAEVLYESESPSSQAEAPTSEPGPIFRFEDFELDVGLCQLRRGGVPVELQPRPLELLQYLIQHRDRVVPKDELLEQVWSDVVVSETALSSALKEVRKATADDGAEQRIIQTRRRQGYRLVAPVTERRSGAPARKSAEREDPRDAFVGREEVLAELGRALDGALEGRGGVALLGGEPGIGKTRTARELAGLARSRAARVLEGWCSEREGAPPYWPWIRILRALTEEWEPEDLRAQLGSGAPDIARILPELRERLGGLPAAPELEPEAMRFRLLDAIAQYLGRASERRPLILVLDDLQWADRASLQVVDHLAREITQSRILLVGTFREAGVEGDHPLGDTLAELVRSEHCARFALAGLPRDETRELVQRRGGSEPSDRWVTAIHEKTDGNPFFVKEIVRELSAEDRLAEADASSAREIGVPRGVLDFIGARMRRLSSDCRETLAVAAVIGECFDPAVVARVLECEEAGLSSVLAEARRLELVARSEQDDREHRFLHALVREAVLSQQEPTERRRLHRRAGQALEALYAPDLDAQLATLAHHFGEAALGGDLDKALLYSRRAAQRSTDLLAYADAGIHYLRALEILDLKRPRDEAERCELLLALGDSQWDAGELNEAYTATYRSALELARKLGVPEAFARAALRVNGSAREAGNLQDPASIIALLEEAVAALGTNGDAALRARALGQLAEIYGGLSDPEGLKERLSREALETARRAGDPEVLVLTLGIRRRALWKPSSHAERLVLCNEMVATATGDGSKGTKSPSFAYEMRIEERLASGDLPGAERDLQASLGAARDYPVPLYQGITRLQRAALAQLQGRFQECEELVSQSLVLAQQIQSGNLRSVAMANLVVLRRDQGRMGEILSQIEAVVGQDPGERTWRNGLAMAYCELGREDDARREFALLAANEFSDIPQNVAWLLLSSLLAEVCAFLGDVGRAGSLYALLKPAAGLNVVAPCMCVGSASRHLGLLAATRARFDEAAAHFEDALAMNERMGARPHVARTQADHARMLLERGGPHDREQALELASQALATARELGMETLAERAEDLGLRAQGITQLRPRERSRRAPR